MIAGCEGKDGQKDVITPPRKKLKQARLSFQKLSPGVETVASVNAKKRKISDDSNEDIKVVKVVKTEDNSGLVQKEHSATETPLVVDLSSSDEKDEGKHSVSDNNSIKCEQSEDADGQVVSNVDSPVCDRDSGNELNGTLPRVDISSDAPESLEETTDNESELNVTVDSSGSFMNDSINQNESSANMLKDVSDKGPLKDNNSIPRSNGVNSEEVKKKRLTPKQILRRQEIVKRREEKEKQRKEKEELKAKEKEVRKKRKLEQREQKLKEKEEKEEQKRKEREEKEKKKQAELELKSEEKRLKEEEKRKKEEQRNLEKKKKDEKKLAEEEAKKKVAAAFANFFVAPKSELKSSEESKISTVENFMPFQIKADMRLAPTVRTKFSEHRAQKFDEIVKEQSPSYSYLKDLKKKCYVPGSSQKTWPLSEYRESVSQDDEDVIFVEGENKVMEVHPSVNQPKAKLLQFCENRRPPYWGTWRKKSKHVKPICPFTKDEGFFDYEVDSDDEWEEEEPGESLHGSDDEKESEDEYEVDNEFFVPHGYLSEEENDGEEDDTMSPETMKAKLKLLELEFEEEMKHKTERVKPRLFGCFWINENSNVDSRILGMLSSYRAVYKEKSIPVCEPTTPVTSSPVNESMNTGTASSSKRRKFPEYMVPELIKLIHGNINGRGFLVKEFSAYLKSEAPKDEQNVSENDGDNIPLPGMASKLCISNKIKQIASWVACPEEGPFLNRFCWYVSKEIREAYGLEDLVIPNKVWNYTITPRKILELSNTVPSPSANCDARQKSHPLITKFTKKMSQEERQKLLVSSQIDDDIEVIDEVKTKSPLVAPNKTSQEVEVTKSNDINPNSESPCNNGGSHDLINKASSSSDIKQKLLQFKAKPSGSTQVQRKRVQILKSVPLGQKILFSNVSSSGNEAGNKSSEKVYKNGGDNLLS